MIVGNGSGSTAVRGPGGEWREIGLNEEWRGVCPNRKWKEVYPSEKWTWVGWGVALTRRFAL